MRSLLLMLLITLSPAVDFPLSGPALTGGRHEIDPVRNRRPAILVFWASWCAVCVREMPAITQFHRSSAGRIDVVSCTIDTDVEAARASVATHQLTYPVILDGGMAIADLFAVDSTPTLVLVGSDGREIARGRSLGHLGDALARLGAKP